MTGGLPQYVTDLLSTDAYDHAVHGVRLIQTHISYVLLAGEFAYKIKKPLDLGFLDYSTLGRRRRMCEDEVRLNRRLCDGIYLGVVAITRAEDGTHRIEGTGEVIEYAVCMRLVPHEATMLLLLESRELKREHLASLASKIALFHERADDGERIASFGRVGAVRFNWRENFEQTTALVGRTLTGAQLDHVRAYIDRFLDEQGVLIEERADTGRVRDSHGDLRVDSVAFGPDGSVCVMDCIEFNERLRCSDVASDVAFLAMDLEFRGFMREADEFVSLYIEESDNDETLPAMMNFYRVYRAYVRGKVDSMQIEEPEISAAQRSEAAVRAVRYFELAEKYALASLPQVLVMTVGLSGTGKSFIARALAGRADAVLLSTDLIRRERANARGLGPAAYADAAYTPQRRDVVYAAMIERATRHLSLKRNVVLDATFLTRRHRELARGAAASVGVPLLVVEMTAGEPVVRERLTARTNNGSASDARWNTYVHQREDFEPLDDVAPASLVRLDTTRPLDQLVDDVLDVVRKLAG